MTKIIPRWGETTMNDEKIARARELGWWDDEDDAMWEIEKQRRAAEDSILATQMRRLADPDSWIDWMATPPDPPDITRSTFQAP